MTAGETSVSFPPAYETVLDEAMRFHLRLNSRGVIIHAGPSLRKLAPTILGQRLVNVATSPMKSVDLTEAPRSIKTGELVRLVFLEPRFTLRGAFIEDRPRGEWVYAASLDPADASRISDLGLSASDFAGADLTLDFSMLQWTRDAEVKDTKDALRRLEESDHRGRQLEKQVATDALTGIPNRSHFVTELDRTLLDPDAVIAAVMIDIDRFKSINDNHGHAAGDKALQFVAGHLKKIVGGWGIVARLGGDEFGALIYSDDLEEIHSICDGLVQIGNQMIATDLSRIELKLSIGVALRSTEQDSRDLLRHADMAMYTARRSASRNQARIGWFDPAAQAELEIRGAIADDLPAAIASAQIEPFFQPVVAMATGKVVGFEVLSRWTHPVHGAIPPALFVEVAEQRLIAQQLDHYMLERAIEIVTTSRRSGAALAELSVNCSVTSLNLDLVDHVRTLLARHNFPAGHLTVEITETVAIDSVINTSSTLHALHEMGVHIALDDFGTGYSSLTYLHDLPIEVLKIDRSFVSVLSTSVKSLQLIRSIVHVARSLGLSVVAEGIETAEQWTTLRNLGCDFAQGFLLAKPAPRAVSMSLLGEQLFRVEVVTGSPVTKAVPDALEGALRTWLLDDLKRMSE